MADSEETYRILGITACPTGIAHTYMAAEGLTQKGKELGIRASIFKKKYRVDKKDS